MIFDLILFCTGMLVIFLMKLSAQDKTKLLEKAASSALVAGSLVTVIKLLVLVSSFEHMELPKEELQPERVGQGNRLAYWRARSFSQTALKSA